jgi:hypothetical protein
VHVHIGGVGDGLDVAGDDERAQPLVVLDQDVQRARGVGAEHPADLVIERCHQRPQELVPGDRDHLLVEGGVRRDHRPGVTDGQRRLGVGDVVAQPLAAGRVATGGGELRGEHLEALPHVEQILQVPFRDRGDPRALPRVGEHEPLGDQPLDRVAQRQP